MREASIKIAEAIPLVVSAIQPYGEDSSRLQIFIQRLDGCFAVGCVMQHSDAVDYVKTLGREGQREYVGLERDEIPVGQILGRNFRSSAQVDPNHARSPAGGYFCEPSHTAAHVEDQLAFQFLRTQSGLHAEMAIRLADLIVIELRLLITMPLKAETGRVMLRLHKTCDPLHVRINALA